MASKNRAPRAGEGAESPGLSRLVGYDPKRSLRIPFKAKMGDPYRFWIDTLPRPPDGHLQCSRAGCEAECFITATDWHSQSYLEFRLGPCHPVTPTVTRVFENDWAVMRLWDYHMILCPAHDEGWEYPGLAEIIMRILQCDRGQLITSPQRDEAILMAHLFDYQRELRLPGNLVQNNQVCATM